MSYDLNYINEYVDASNVYCVETDGTYIFIGTEDGVVRALTWDGSSYTSINTYNAPARVYSLCHDGTYLHAALGLAGAWDELVALSWDGANFTLEDSYNVGSACSDIYYDGTYLYVGMTSRDPAVFSFSGGAYTLRYTDTADIMQNVTGDGTYIYTTDGDADTLRALTFDGTTLTIEASIDTGNTLYDICMHLGYVVVCRAGGKKLHIYSFNGTTFTLVASYTTAIFIYNITSDGTYIFGLGNDGEILAFYFDGSTITLESTVVTGDIVESDGTGIVIDASGYLHTAHRGSDSVKATEMGLTANIAATPTSGRAPLTVQFYGS